jgi:hypothetical protein
MNNEVFVSIICRYYRLLIMNKYIFD